MKYRSIEVIHKHLETFRISILRSKSQALGNESQILINESQILRNKSQILRSDH